MDKKHFDNFKRYAEETYGREWWFGCNVRKWYKKVCGKEVKSLPNKNLSRKELKEICKHGSGNSDFVRLVSVMAWGSSGTKREMDYAKTFFKNRNSVQFAENIIKKLRTKSILPLEAYEKFFKAKTPGLGATSYTKIIFFCHPKHKGYIMDQWTSKSVNLLHGKGTIPSYKKLSAYKRYCEIVDDLAKHLNRSGEDIEKALFSNGGRCPWLWRAYVLAHCPCSECRAKRKKKLKNK